MIGERAGSPRSGCLGNEPARRGRKGPRRLWAHALGAALLIGLTQLPGAPSVRAATLAWVPTGSLAAARTGAASALLADGRVMVAGGLAAGTNSALRSVELYNPATGVWTRTRDMLVPRAWFTITRLNDGRVLAVGGFNASLPPNPSCNGSQTGPGVYVDTTELWSPAGGAWSSAPSLPGATCPGKRAHHAAVVLTDGRVLVAGGGDTPNTTEYPDGSRSLFLTGDSSEPAAVVYSPAANNWTATTGFYFPLERQTLTRLADGRVLAAGGYEIGFNNTPVTYESRELSQFYDPVKNGWTDTPGSLNTIRAGHIAALLPGGTVLVAGGESNSSSGVNNPAITSAEIFNPATGSWVATSSMHSSRAFASAVTLPGGNIMVIGGIGIAGGNCTSGCSPTALGSAEILTPGKPGGLLVLPPVWVPTPPLNHARSDHIAVTLVDGRVLAATSGPAANTAELYETPPPPPPPPPSPPPAGCVPAPKLVANPALASPGDATMVTGSGFCPGAVALVWVGGLGKAAAVADAGGNFHVSLLVLPHDALGPRTIVATQGAASLSIPFLVVPAPLEPPDFRWRR